MVRRDDWLSVRVQRRKKSSTKLIIYSSITYVVSAILQSGNKKYQCQYYIKANTENMNVFDILLAMFYISKGLA